MRLKTIFAACVFVALSFGKLTAAAPVEFDHEAIERDKVFNPIIEKVKSVSGNTRADYFHPGALLYKQIEAGLIGKPGPSLRLDDGATLISGSRYRFGDEKAAVIVDNSRAIRSAALIHFHCHFTDGKALDLALTQTDAERKARPSTCDVNINHPLGLNATLTIFHFAEADKKAKATDKEDEAVLKHWAQMVGLHAHEEVVYVSNQ